MADPLQHVHDGFLRQFADEVEPRGHLRAYNSRQTMQRRPYGEGIAVDGSSVGVITWRGCEASRNKFDA